MTGVTCCMSEWPALEPSDFYAEWGVVATSFVDIFVLDAPFPLIVLAAGLIGYVGGRYTSDKFKPGGGRGKARMPGDNQGESLSSRSSRDIVQR
jgi:chromate transport protein ChrA